MHRLRHATFLARLVLAWFVLSLGVAVAAPVVSPGGMELVCSGGGGMKLLVKDAQGAPAAASAALECPLCATSAAAPPPACPVVSTPPSLTDLHLRSARIDWMPMPGAAPLQARGPPAPDTRC